MAENTASSRTDELRLKYGFWIVALGLIVIAAAFTAAILKWPTASDVATVVGSITGVVGTVIGAFFGVHIGSAGKERAEAAQDKAEKVALRLAGALHPDVAERIMRSD